MICPELISIHSLPSDSYTVKDGDAVDGIAYVIESYGLIVQQDFT